MKATELRIGNICETPSFNIPRLGLSSVEIDGKAFAKLSLHGLNLIASGDLEFKPVQLSDNWFMKLGFEMKTDSVPGIGEYCWFDNGKYEVIHVHTGLYSLKDVNGIPFRYVHELQNLVYALTHKELPI